MDSVEVAEGYKPDAGFQEDSREPLCDITLNDSTELWLIQWPHNEVPHFDGKELPLNLNHDGCLGSFEGATGKVYDVVSCAAQEPDASVFLSSTSGSRIVGKISRRVSLVHYPDPKELEKQEAEKKLKRMRQMSAGSSLLTSTYQSSTPSQSAKHKSQHSSRAHTASTHSSRRKSSLSEVGEQSNAQKRRRIHETAGSTDQSTLDSGRSHSIYTLSDPQSTLNKES